MKINNNLNGMINLEKDLEKSAINIANVTTQDNQKDQNTQDINLANELVAQSQIALTYSVNGSVISVQNSVDDTLLDIKA